MSKRYLLGSPTPSLLTERIGEIFGRSSVKAKDEFWALKDVSFEVRRGDVVGIVGRNGAGKSTLLKILSRVTSPTEGRVRIGGRVVSLLEVGTGFHPELTGRENIYLNATILGMRRSEIRDRFDEIVTFSGVESFIDTPVKRYSSGMYVRLAFAVAAHVAADVLLVDEVLAVGDAEFQKRCMGKMQDVATQGRTILFVSHNMTALRNLCNSGIFFDSGRVAKTGPIAEVVEAYLPRSRGGSGRVDTGRDVTDATPAVITSVQVDPVHAAQTDRIGVSSPLRVVVRVKLSSAQEIGAFLHCYDAKQELVFSSGSFFEASLNGLVLGAGSHEFECRVPAHLLNDGDYSLDVMLVRGRQDVVASETSVLSLRVEDDTPPIDGWHWRPAGVVRPQLAWACSSKAEEP